MILIFDSVLNFNPAFNSSFPAVERIISYYKLILVVTLSFLYLNPNSVITVYKAVNKLS